MCVWVCTATSVVMNKDKCKIQGQQSLLYLLHTGYALGYIYLIYSRPREPQLTYAPIFHTGLAPLVSRF